MKNIILSLLLVFALVHPVFAEDDMPNPPQEVAQMGEMVDVDVNGLVCDFCARALEKTFGQHEEVLHTEVNLDTKRVTVHLKKGKNLDDETITKLITDAGYKVNIINRREK